MIDRVLESMFHWWRVVGAASPGARTIERDGVLAAVVPTAPERAVINSVLYRDVRGFEAGYDELAAAYDEVGATWTVWVPPGDRTGAALLAERGHFLDAEPAAMGRELSPGAVERPPEGALDWTADGDFADVGPLNDASYPFGTDSFSRSLARLPQDSGAHVYLARLDGEPAGCLVMLDHEGNSEVQMVAVRPEARGAGLSGMLLAHALADAAARGVRSSTLIATRLGRPVYERAGFRAVGTFQMWEVGPRPT